MQLSARWYAQAIMPISKRIRQEWFKDHMPSRGASFLHRLIFASLLISPLPVTPVTYAATLVDDVRPRLSFTALTDGDAAGGYADFFAPLIRQPNALWYGDWQAQYASNKAWWVGLGGGYRQIVSDTQLLGGYLFLDRAVTSQHSGFWLASPGFEVIGQNWEFRTNGYVPIGTQQRILNEVAADHFFMGHHEYNTFYNQLEEIGYGIDARIARTFSQRVTPYIGGYYFYPRHSARVLGVSIGVTYAINPSMMLEVSDTYDHQRHHTVTAGIRLTWGGQYPGSPLIEDHLRDPIKRYLANTGIDSVLPITQRTVKTGKTTTVRANIQFFTPTGTGQTCTYEQPCGPQQFTQAKADQLMRTLPGANFYLSEGGDYSLAGQSRLSRLNLAQSLFGRTTDFSRESQGDQQPLLKGGLQLLGNNTLSGIRLVNDNSRQRAGISIINAHDVRISNVRIGERDARYGYQIGMEIKDSQRISLEDSEIVAKAQGQGNGEVVRGVDTRRSEAVSLRGNIFHLEGFTQQVDGLYMQEGNVFAVQNRFMLNAASKLGDISGVTVEAGQLMLQGNTFDLTGSAWTVNGLTMQSGNAAVLQNRFNLKTHALFANQGSLVEGGQLILQDNIFDLGGTALLANGLVIGQGSVIAVHNKFDLGGLKVDTADMRGGLYGAIVTAGRLTLKDNAFKLGGSRCGEAACSVIGLVMEGGKATVARNLFSVTESKKTGAMIGIYASAGQLNLQDNGFDFTGSAQWTRGFYLMGGNVITIHNQFNLSTHRSDGVIDGVSVDSGQLTAKDNTFTLLGPNKHALQKGLPKNSHILDKGGNQWKLIEE